MAEGFVNVEIKGSEEVADFVAQLPQQLYSQAREQFGISVTTIQANVVKRLQGDPMQSRTGMLARSIIPKVEGSTLATLNGRVFSTVVYSRIHEMGGVISAKRAYRWLPGGPYLNIPTEANKTPAGVQRITPSMAFQQGGKVKSCPQGFGIYVGNVMMFSFARKVTIKAQLGLVAAATAEVTNLMTRLKSIPLEGNA